MKQAYLYLIIYIAALLTLGACQEQDGFGSSYEPSLEKKGATTPETTLSVDPTSLSFEAKGGSKDIIITSNTSWKVSTSAEWFAVNQSSGEGNSTITITALENNTDSQRTATMVFTYGKKRQEINVTQAEGNITPNEGDNVLPNKK